MRGKYSHEKRWHDLAEVLSQHEIDQLFHAISSGETLAEEARDGASGQKVRAYDFSKANKFSKEQMRTLHIVFDSLSRQMGSYFSGTLRALCEVNVVSVEEQVFKEFNNSLPSPVVLALLGMAPLQGPLMLSISPVVAYGIINRLFGGSGKSGESDRTFTEIELAVLERILRQMLPLLVEPWEKITKVDPVLDRIETSTQFVQIVNVNEAVAIITMQLKTADIDGFMHFCIPHIAIEPIAKQLTTTLMFSGTTHKRIMVDHSRTIQKRILDTSLNVKAILAETTMTVEDVLSLRLGDVIQLDNTTNDLVKVKVEHLTKAYGRLGVRNGRYAIRLTKILREEDATDE
jgi:flagellar motor switch protein FliM